jgi:rSAM/selenodomain-associated transferase 1
MPRPVVVIMAKQPVAGRTKTRLCPPLSAKQAAGLYAAMLRDTIEWASSLADLALAVAITPPDAAQAWSERVAPDTLLLPVAGADIGECLNIALSELLSNGYTQALALNSDGPTLPPSYLSAAVARLDEVDLVLGPSEDGGYYLIGLKAPVPALFEGITWSTAQVMAQTLSRAQQLGLTVSLLQPWYDIDSPADLDRLRAELLTLPADRITHTRRFLTVMAEESRTACLRQVEGAAAELHSLLSGIPYQAWLETAAGRWTVKDVLGHLLVWSELLLDEVDALVPGTTKSIRAVDIDAWNAEQVTAHRGWPVDRLKAAWDSSVSRSVRTLQQVPAERWQLRRTVPWATEPVAPSGLLRLWLLHIHQHQASLAAWSQPQRIHEERT